MKIKNVVVINDVTNDLNDGKFFYDQKEANIRIQLTQKPACFYKNSKNPGCFLYN